VRIFDNLAYKLVSVLVAAALWGAAQGVRNVEKSLDLQLAVQDVPDGLVVVDQSTHEVNLRLKGSQAALRRAQQELTHYTVSLHGAKEGETRYPLDTEGLPLPRGAEVVARSPSQLVFRTEAVMSKLVPVRADLGGTLPEGYKLREVVLEPPEVELTGARTGVRRVREVSTERVELADVRQSTTLERRLLIGVPYVWRQDGESTPVKVHLVIESPPEATTSQAGGRPSS
jgi:YbbR domain-containing protein